MANQRPSEGERNADGVARRDEGGADVPREATRASPETRRAAEKGGARKHDKATSPLPDIGVGSQDGDPGGKDISGGG